VAELDGLEGRAALALQVVDSVVAILPEAMQHVQDLAGCGVLRLDAA
jgi:hypothetical protein